MTKQKTRIYETDWVNAQEKGELPWYHPENGLYYEKKGTIPPDGYRRVNPIRHVGQKLTHIHSPEMFGRDEVLYLDWVLDYAGRCPKCRGIMHRFQANVQGIPDSGYDVEQCYDCGYYE